ncbi:MAG: hypothetical protein AB8B64_13615 [Granulosicoccus sp.]
MELLSDERFLETSVQIPLDARQWQMIPIVGYVRLLPTDNH